MAGVATIRVCAPASRGSPSFGVSSRPCLRWRMTAAGSSIPYLRSTARASAKVVGSGTVGPEPITAGSSPGTSEIRRLTRRAGWQAVPSRPPLMAERCLRTALISPIAAPERSSAPVTACLSASAIPGAGRVSSAEPPPETRQSARSSAPSPSAMARMRAAASRPPASGTGCAASTTSIARVGTRWPYRVTTRPSRGPSQ